MIAALWCATRAAAVLLLVAMVVAWNPDSVASRTGNAAAGPLDGMVFEGRIGPADDPDLPDYLYFERGRFWSGECVRCGFEPGIYWVRHLDEGIAFRGVLQSADRGTFTYEGRIRGDQIEVSINWRQDRWYWTIDRDLRFVGARLENESAAMTLEKARDLARSGAPRSERCPG